MNKVAEEAMERIIEKYRNENKTLLKTITGVFRKHLILREAGERLVILLLVRDMGKELERKSSSFNRKQFEEDCLKY